MAAEEMVTSEKILNKNTTEAFFKYLTENFGENRPILVEEIKFNGYPRTQITDMLDDLCRCEKLSRYYNEDVYYIPIDTLLGKIFLSTKRVIERKYIRNDTDVYGFYGGVAMYNYMGLSTLVASTPTIYTNKETAEKRKVQVGWCDVILKKGRTRITADNAYTLTFLEVLTDAPEWWFRDKDEETEEKMECLASYINSAKITEQSINKYLPLFPDSTAEKLKESGLVFYTGQ